MPRHCSHALASSFLVLLLAIPMLAVGSPHKRTLEVQLLKAEAEYQLQASEERKEALILALENFASYSCLGSPRGLRRHAGYDIDSGTDCAKHLARILELHDESSIALCIRDGFNSPVCLEATSHLVPISASELSRRSQSQSALSSERRSELEAAEREFAEEKNLENRNKLIAIYRSILSQVCDPVVRRTIDKESYAAIQSSRAAGEPIDPILQKIIQKKAVGAAPPASSSGRSAHSSRGAPPTSKATSSRRAPPAASSSPRGSAATDQSSSRGSTGSTASQTKRSKPESVGDLPPSDSPTAKLLERIQALEPDDKPKEPEPPESTLNSYTLRIIPDQCILHLERLAKILPESSLPDCIRFGSYSLQCQRAVDREIATPIAGEKLPPATDERDFSTF